MHLRIPPFLRARVRSAGARRRNGRFHRRCARGEALEAPLDARSRHLSARSGAAPAGLGTTRHQLVPLGQTLALLGARLAHLGAQAADMAVVVRRAEHEPCRRCADVRAVVQQSLVLRRRMIAAHPETMRAAFDAEGGTLLAMPDALSHLARGLVMRHLGLLPVGRAGLWTRGALHDPSKPPHGAP